MELKLNEAEVLAAMAIMRLVMQNERLAAEVTALQQKIKELEAKNGGEVSNNPG